MQAWSKHKVLTTGASLLIFSFAGLIIFTSRSEPFSASAPVAVFPADQFIQRLPAIPYQEEETSASTPTYPPKVVKEPEANTSVYPLHIDILATVFWVGEEASQDNGWVTNAKSAWDTAWQEHYGGLDDPNNRNGYHPAAFRPKENPFYVALPYMEYADGKIKDNVNKVYWYALFEMGTSILKNRWVKIMANGKTVFGQWQDVGPFETDDVSYVFGLSRPRHNIGLDVSPAIRDYLGVGGMFTASWQFVDEQNVPQGPWREIVTVSGVTW